MGGLFLPETLERGQSAGVGPTGQGVPSCCLNSSRPGNFCAPTVPAHRLLSTREEVVSVAEPPACEPSPLPPPGGPAGPLPHDWQQTTRAPPGFSAVTQQLWGMAFKKDRRIPFGLGRPP